ncbi:hypothetical protein [Methylomonas albis]|uniref:Uncharacterized protein n=1 Tax=Methylomonas albis TaxID=1854563 RepID=A0ABR9D3J6_9GAMM|nr:hypothetical protein [Methylomonas albis]MBD9357371.1 hypothetical protein [Methylomonas albis]
MTRIRTITSFTSLSFLILAAANVIVSTQAADLDRQEHALAIIADFSDKFCKTVPLNGEAENLELSAQGQAEVSKLLRKIAGLGFLGAAEYQKSGYVGVLQQDLAMQLKDNMTCRSTVWSDLKDKLLEPKRPLATTGAKSKPPAKTNANEIKGSSGGQSHDEDRGFTVNGSYNNAIKISGGSGNTITTNINEK